MSAVAAAVEEEKIRTLFGVSVPVLMANAVNAGIVCFTLWSTAPHARLAVWTATVTALTLARVELRRRYWKRRPPAAEAARWGRRFVAGSVAAGTLWGLAAIVFIDAASPLSQLLVTFVIGGMSAGAAGMLSCHRPAFFAYTVPSLAPLVVRMLAFGDGAHFAMSMMLVVYGLALAMAARSTGRSLLESFRLRFENDALVARLSEAHATLAETNRTLEERVQERTAALERQAEALREAQRLESVGRLAGGIAHDFNNLLTVVLANVTLLLRETRLPDTARAALDEVEAAAGRGAELVRQLLAFGRRQRLDPRVLDVNEVLASLERLLARLAGERVKLIISRTLGGFPSPPAMGSDGRSPSSPDAILSASPGRLLVRADRTQLERVVVNLVTNARDAMPAGGELTIATAVALAEGDATLPAGAYVVVSVSDTGTGMDAETRRHVFEPFFTTKDVGKGTGLGLATVYGIVEQSGGRVFVESEPGAGSSFLVYLPRVAEARAEEASSSASGKASGGGGGDISAIAPGAGATILLAEDDPGVRAAVQRVLASSGYEVLAAPDGETALTRARAHGGRIDLLVTDVVMPGMGGGELARRLTSERPGLPVLFISGHSPDTTLPERDPVSGVDHLAKPVSFETLARTVAALLAGPLGAAGPPDRPGLRRR